MGSKLVSKSISRQFVVARMKHDIISLRKDHEIAIVRADGAIVLHYLGIFQRFGKTDSIADKAAMAVCFIGISSFESRLGCHFEFREDEKVKIDDVQDLSVWTAGFLYIYR
jgi:hypothetical protein